MIYVKGNAISVPHKKLGGYSHWDSLLENSGGVGWGGGGLVGTAEVWKFESIQWDSLVATKGLVVVGNMSCMYECIVLSQLD